MNYKSKIIAALFCALFGNAFAQETGIKDIKVLKSGAFENQGKSSTCWSFSGMSFFQAELLRMGKADDLNLSEMFVVRNMYPLKAENFVRMHGKANFGEGGGFSDNLICLRNYGLVPQAAYSGKAEDGTYNHQQILEKLEPMLNKVANAPATIDTRWRQDLNAVLDQHLDAVPQSFDYKGKNYTPQSFAKELGLKAEDYILITSFTHHPYYKPFVLEVPDNWNWESVYNLPVSELTEVAKVALQKGYSVAWAADVSDPGFSREKAIALANEGKAVSAEERQKAFDNFDTQDDHGMLLVGLAEDAKGGKYFKVKNSWGERFPAGKFLYASENYFAYKTTAIMVNKHALPKGIAKKLGV